MSLFSAVTLHTLPRKSTPAIPLVQILCTTPCRQMVRTFTKRPKNIVQKNTQVRLFKRMYTSMFLHQKQREKKEACTHDNSHQHCEQPVSGIEYQKDRTDMILWCCRSTTPHCRLCIWNLRSLCNQAGMPLKSHTCKYSITMERH